MPAPLIIGHRGASAVAPENTMAAFREAIATGADGIEFDVRLTRDGVPVIIHDSTLRRTGGLQRRVSDLAASELEQVDVGSWFAPAFAQATVLGLAICAVSGGMLQADRRALVEGASHHFMFRPGGDRSREEC